MYDGIGPAASGVEDCQSCEARVVTITSRTAPAAAPAAIQVMALKPINSASTPAMTEPKAPEVAIAPKIHPDGCEAARPRAQGRVLR